MDTRPWVIGLATYSGGAIAASIALSIDIKRTDGLTWLLQAMGEDLRQRSQRYDRPLVG